MTNLKNGRTVEVRVNDRGPVAAGRMIDLSYAAAEELDAVSDGLIPVHVRVVSRYPEASLAFLNTSSSVPAK